MASANETSDHSPIEVEKDKRAAERSTRVDEQVEPLEQDDDTNNTRSGDSRREDHPHGNGSNDKNNTRARGGNRRGFWSRGGRGHFKQPHRGGQQPRNSDDGGHQEESGGHQRIARGHFHGHQRARGTKFLTVSAASSSRDVQFGNGDQLLIKVDLSSSASNVAGHQQAKPNNQQQQQHQQHHQQQHQQQQRSSISEMDGEHPHNHRQQGRNGKGSEVRFISTGQSEGNRQEYPPDQKSEQYHHHQQHHHHHNPPGRGFDHHRRGFRPPRRSGGGRWQRGFLPPRDFGETRAEEDAHRGGRGFRMPRGGRVFRRRGQNPRGKGPYGPPKHETSAREETENAPLPKEDSEHGSHEEQKNVEGENSGSVEEDGNLHEEEAGVDDGDDVEEEAEAFHDTEDVTPIEADGRSDEQSQSSDVKSTTEQNQESTKSPKDDEASILKEVENDLTDDLSSMAIGGPEPKGETLPRDVVPKERMHVDASDAPEKPSDPADDKSPSKAEASEGGKVETSPGGKDRPQDPASGVEDKNKVPPKEREISEAGGDD